MKYDDEKDFEKQQERDRLKQSLCIENNILLIIIPYTMSTKSQLDNFILNELNKHGHLFQLDMLNDVHLYK